jgi:hypothetical protein
MFCQNWPVITRGGGRIEIAAVIPVGFVLPFCRFAVLPKRGSPVAPRPEQRWGLSRGSRSAVRLHRIIVRRAACQSRTLHQTREHYKNIQVDYLGRDRRALRTTRLRVSSVVLFDDEFLADRIDHVFPRRWCSTMCLASPAAMTRIAPATKPAMASTNHCVT